MVTPCPFASDRSGGEPATCIRLEPFSRQVHGSSRPAWRRIRRHVAPVRDELSVKVEIAPRRTLPTEVPSHGGALKAPPMPALEPLRGAAHARRHRLRRLGVKYKPG